MNLYFQDLISSSYFQSDRRRGNAKLFLAKHWSMKIGDLYFDLEWAIKIYEREGCFIAKNIIPLKVSDHEFHPEYWTSINIDQGKVLVQFTPEIIDRMKRGRKYPYSCLFPDANFFRFRIGKRRYLLFHTFYFGSGGEITEQSMFRVHGSWKNKFTKIPHFDPRMNYCLLTLY
jgi:hypothetical protein